MGTGKSRAAKILSDGLEWQLADTDRMMERETGKKIADIYKEAGPEAFAEKEMQVINHVRYYHEAVIAMGGNYPMTEEKFHLLSAPWMDPSPPMTMSPPMPRFRRICAAFFWFSSSKKALQRAVFSMVPP